MSREREKERGEMNPYILSHDCRLIEEIYSQEFSIMHGIHLVIGTGY